MYFGTHNLAKKYQNKPNDRLVERNLAARSSFQTEKSSFEKSMLNINTGKRKWKIKNINKNKAFSPSNII